MAKTTLKARQTPHDLSGCGWYDTLEPVAPQSALEKTISTDWLVIGAGFAGLSATQRLLQINEAAEVVLLEAQRLAWGACGRNSGFMIDLPHDMQSDNYTNEILTEPVHQKTRSVSADSGTGSNHFVTADRELEQASNAPQAKGGYINAPPMTSNKVANEIALNRMAIEFGADITQRYNLQDAYQQCGKYHGAASHQGTRALDSFCMQLRTQNEPFETLNAADLKDITGSDYYTGGIFTPGCAIIQPAAYIRGFASGLIRRYNSLQVFEQTPALRIEPGKPHCISTPHGKVIANKILLCVNGHLASFGYHTNQLIHAFTYASMTQPLTCRQLSRLGGASHWGLVAAHPMGTTVRRTVDNRIVIRNSFSFNPTMRTSAKQVAKFGRQHDKAFARRFRQLSNVAMEYRWGGHLCLSRNSAYVFGELQENLYAACCHNALGTTKGTTNGLLLADLACGVKSDAVNRLLKDAKPQQLPPEPFLSAGAKITLQVQQLRAGKER